MGVNNTAALAITEKTGEPSEALYRKKRAQHSHYNRTHYLLTDLEDKYLVL